MMPLRGDIYYASLDPVIGSEEGGIRPVVIIQNNIGNRHSPTVIAATITSRRKSPLPVHVPICPGVSGLDKPSTIMLEQIRTLDSERLRGRIGRADGDTLRAIDQALRCSFGLS